jgi:hypothetical protein
MHHAFGSGASLGFAAGLRFCACVLVGCETSPHGPVHTEPSPAERAPQPALSAPDARDLPPANFTNANADGDAGQAAMFPGTSLNPEQILSALSQSELRALRPVGSTSTVFRAQLDAPFRAAFKAATQQRPLGAVAEVAAYRLARCLGLDNVPPAVLRRVPTRTLRQELEAEFAQQWPSIAPRLLVSRDGHVEGAAIYWIEGLRGLDLVNPEWRASAQRVLRLSEPLSDPPPPLASGLSSMQAFDYLIGNWDRWSGSNVKGDATGQILYVRDQDAAFAGRLREGLQRRLLEPVLASERFSRRFVERLRMLTRSSYERELAADALFAERHRLEERSLAGVFERRAALLSHVTALIAAHGEDRVLAFP